ncbi:hypothetical protein AEAC466_01975 [Asticcacaulis sp. AC466]|nr:hypothetical protein AEAC466_01975 [Asticcacaulis sp. AC466]
MFDQSATFATCPVGAGPVVKALLRIANSYLFRTH